MATKIKKKKKKSIAPKAQTTMPLTGAGVEELRIPSLDAKLDKLIASDKAFDEAKEARDDDRKAVLAEFKEHRDKMVQEVNGGVSYAYDSRLFKVAPTGEKLTVKVVHDKNLGGEED